MIYSPTTVHDQLAFYRGDTFELLVTCLDVDGNPIPLGTASLIEWKMDTMDGLTNIFTLTKDAGIYLTDTDGANGECLVTVTADQSSGLETGYYRDQLKITIDDVVKTQAVGRIQVLESIV